MMTDAEYRLIEKLKDNIADLTSAITAATKFTDRLEATLILQNWSNRSKGELSDREEYFLDRNTLSKLCELFGLWPS